jgi:hypothetical protein
MSIKFIQAYAVQPTICRTGGALVKRRGPMPRPINHTKTPPTSLICKLTTGCASEVKPSPGDRCSTYNRDNSIDFNNYYYI